LLINTSGSSYNDRGFLDLILESTLLNNEGSVSLNVDYLIGGRGMMMVVPGVTFIFFNDDYIGGGETENGRG